MCELCGINNARDRRTHPKPIRPLHAPSAKGVREIEEGTAGIEIEGARLPEAVLAMTETR